jgi:hypothetical protein
MNLVKFGFSCYLEENGQYFHLTYPQYRVLVDFDTGRVEEEEIEERLKHYQHLAKMIVCPICGAGQLPREYIQMLKKLDKDGNMHDHTIHA